MANDWAVPDGLNSDECFGPSADEYSIIAARLAYELLVLRFIEKPPFRSVFDRRIRGVSGTGGQN
jgi:hypothetical protein